MYNPELTKKFYKLIELTVTTDGSNESVWEEITNTVSSLTEEEKDHLTNDLLSEEFTELLSMGF